MARPIIGILSSRQKGNGVLPIYRSTAHYLEEVEKAGGLPVQIPILPDSSDQHIADYVDLCDGFLFPGGGDFSSSWYGQALLSTLQPSPYALDMRTQEAGLAMVRQAAAAGKAILGICLGAQVINIAFGGTLYQDIPTQIETTLSHSNRFEVIEQRWATAHTVEIAPNSLLHAILGTHSIEVNSFHHQAVCDVAPGFTATAWAPDGVIEAIESDHHRILGVQWHPENLAHVGIPHAEALFRWLVETAQ